MVGGSNLCGNLGKLEARRRCVFIRSLVGDEGPSLIHPRHQGNNPMTHMQPGSNRARLNYIPKSQAISRDGHLPPSSLFSKK